MMRKRSTMAAALAALATLAGCSREQEAELEENLPVAAPAPEVTAPLDTTNSIPADTSSIVPVP